MSAWLQRFIGSSLRYALTSAFCACLNVAILYIGTKSLGLNYLIAAMFTCFITIPISYFLHKGISFQLGFKVEWSDFLRFLSGQLTQFFIGLLTLVVIVETFGVQPWLAMICATIILFFAGYCLNAIWVFKFFRNDD